MPEERPLGSVARRLAATQRVMVVEDEHDIADFLRAYFRASGYDLVHIDPDTPLEVLDALDEHSPDCVLLDLNLRGFNGAEAYRLLRTDERYALLPVIVVSARPDARELLEAVGGVDAFVTKPFNVNSLSTLVAERIAGAARLRDEAGNDPITGLLGHDYVEARLLDELTVAAPDRAAAFALARLRSLAEITTTVGAEGRDYVARELVRRVKALLPVDATLGLTRSAELAVLLPGTDTAEAATVLRRTLAELGEMRLPGGAEVAVRLSVGLACYPEHAADADGLYMAADAALADAVDGELDLVIAI
ncbi:MAG: response regulator [Acidimicrobiales bacterium]